MSNLPFDPKSLSSKELILYEQLLAKRKQMGAPFDGPYKVLMNHPELCEKIEALGYYLKFQGHLPRNIYQFVVLGVSRETNATFEWEDHISHAVSEGIPKEVIDLLKKESIKSPSFPIPYSLAAELLTYVLQWKSISQELQNNCIAAYGKLGFIEIVTLSGFYQLMGAINQGFDITIQQR